MPPSSVNLTIVSTNPRVPISNGGISKTPMGPLKTIFLMPFSEPSKSSTVLGPTSRPIHPSSIPWPGTKSNVAVPSIVVLGSFGNSFAQTASIGSTIFLFFDLASSISCFAVSIMLSSTRLFPIVIPCAFKNVKASPPPKINVSTCSRRPLMTGNFVETFDPPMMAATSSSGPSELKSRYEISEATRHPTPQSSGCIKAGTPVTLAWALWQVPNASLMYASASEARDCAKEESFFSSPV
mmetsp:Transcript_25514/g.36335  ORF Transcript_25514/g.36335 Transcript_25514/m.36335 type:complete len:239 (+) Transcript_25514:288-1004(+)